MFALLAAVSYILAGVSVDLSQYSLDIGKSIASKLLGESTLVVGFDMSLTKVTAIPSLREVVWAGFTTQFIWAGASLIHILDAGRDISLKTVRAKGTENIYHCLGAFDGHYGKQQRHDSCFAIGAGVV